MSASPPRALGWSPPRFNGISLFLTERSVCATVAAGPVGIGTDPFAFSFQNKINPVWILVSGADIP